MKRILSVLLTAFLALSIGAAFLMLVFHWWGKTAAVVALVIECVVTMWTVYEMRHAYKEHE